MQMYQRKILVYFEKVWDTSNKRLEKYVVLKKTAGGTLYGLLAICQ